MLVLEKNTGQVKRVVDGVVTDTVLELGVNNNSSVGCSASRCIGAFRAIRASICTGPAAAQAARSRFARFRMTNEEGDGDDNEDEDQDD